MPGPSPRGVSREILWDGFQKRLSTSSELNDTFPASQRHRGLVTFQPEVHYRPVGLRFFLNGICQANSGHFSLRASATSEVPCAEKHGAQHC